MYKTVGFNIFEANLDELIYGVETAAELRAEYQKISRAEKSSPKESLNEKPFQTKRDDGSAAKAERERQ